MKVMRDLQLHNFLQEVEKKRVMMQEKVRPPEELVKEFFNLVEPQTSYRYAVLPYIKGLTEPLERILKPCDIRVATKPLCTLQQLFPSPKDRPPPENQINVVYKINCSDCSWSYCTLAKPAEHLTQGERNT